ncbi:MAG: hypothetical protein WBQ18_09630 [Solirubrobacteraceae bacterium]
MSEREDYEQLADSLDHEAHHMEEQSEKLGDEIGTVREDWEHKRADPGVPGAAPPSDGERAPTDADGSGTPETETDRD